MNVFITVVILLAMSFLFSYIAKKLNVPTVVGLIIAGLVVGIPNIKGIIIAPNEELIYFLGDIGLICLMFLAGIESSWKVLNKEKIDATYIAIFSAIVPFLLGFVVFYLLGFSPLISLIIGIAMSITAEATKAKILLDLNKLKSRVGSAMMGAGIIDDILGLIFFISITIFFRTTPVRENLLIVAAIAAFLIGVFIPSNYHIKKKFRKNLEKLLMWSIIPFFFISIGLEFDFNSLFFQPQLLIIIITIAIIGKLIGVYLTKPFTKFKNKQLLLIGWGMNSRGAVEVAIALIAYRSGLIPIEIYSSLVIMGLVTTIMFSIIIIRMIKKNPRIMN